MKTDLLKMRRVLKATLFVMVLTVVEATNAIAQSFTSNNLNYSVNSDGVSVTVTGLANTSYHGACNIPESVSYNSNSYSVTKIAASAFYNCTGITSATIPSTLTFIGNEAFRGCSGLVTLNYNATNCTIQSLDYAHNYWSSHWLYECPSLVNLNIGEGVQSIPNYFICGYYYSQYGYGTYSGYPSLTGTIIIPNSVTSIGEYAFYRCINVGSVRIGNSVTSIGSNAFASCTNLGSVTIGNSVTSMGAAAFADCSSLQSVVIPNSLTTISNDLFSGCGMLTSVTIPNTVVLIGNYAFENCNSLATLVIPNSVVSIEKSAFYGCSSLASVSFGESLVSIGEYAFYGCSNIASLVIPNAVASIGKSAFYGCSRMSSLTIGDAVSSIGESAFYNCSGLTSVTFGNSLASIGKTAFYGCTNLLALNIPASVDAIGVNAFGNCTALRQLKVASGNTTFDSRNNCNAIILTSANKIVAGCKNTVIPNTVTVIGSAAFSGCTGLTGSLNIPNSVLTIEDDAFSGCTGITSLTIPSSVTLIGDRAFKNCNNLVTLNYNAINCFLGGHNYATESYYSAHWLNGCSSLANLNIGAGVQSIPNYFICGYYYSSSTYGSTSLTGTVVIPNSVTSIGKYAFYRCSNITSVTIGNSVTSIGDDAFENCTNLGSVTIGNSVTSIGISAFENCSNLISVVIPSSVTTISNYMFYGCSMLNAVTIPNTVVSIGNYAFYGCNRLASVGFGESLTSIGTSAFYNCSSIASMSVYADNPPVVWSNAFYNVPQSIPVAIPCGTLSAYQAVSGWSSFTNMQEMECPDHEITAIANPTSGGIVTGSGTYTHGTSCTVTATANEGYTFINWLENGEEVSTNASYTFTVTGDRNLEARFNLNSNHWTPESANYSDNMALYSVIMIDGIEQRSDMLELGAFCNGECRGSAIAEEFELTHRYLAMLTVFGETGDLITFKLYDHNTEQELEVAPTSTIVFYLDGYGTPAEPYELNFISSVEISATVDPAEAGTVTGAGNYAPGATCTLTAVANEGYLFTRWTKNGTVVSTEASYSFETTENAEYVAHFQPIHSRTFIAGWNWYSTYIEQSGIDGLTMLENNLGTDGLRIQGRNGIVDQFEYQGSYYWYGTLNSITNEEMYKIRTGASCTAVMIGEAASPADHPVVINSGWNWIGFPVSHSVDVADALSGFTPADGDVIKGRNSSTSYLADYNMWYGTLNTLEPGQGYMYKSNSVSTKTLTFQTGVKAELAANITSEGNIFMPNDAEFASNMLVTAVVEMDGVELRSDNYELAVFVGDECRGSVKLMYVAPLDRYVAFLTIFGDETADLHFALTDGVDTRWSDNMMVYSADANEGTLTEPFTISFDIMGVHDNAQLQAVVYPNPTSGLLDIRCEGINKIEIVNIYGQLVMTKEENTDHQLIDLSDHAAGVYLLRIFTDKGMVSKQIVKE
jgi:hypothetical protein